jgi:hypothetical protein
MVPSSGGLPRYLVDNIMKPTPCTLVVPYGRMSRRQMTVGVGLVLPGCMDDKKLIPAEYARVEVTWTNPDHADDEIDIPTPEGIKYLRSIVSMEVL